MANYFYGQGSIVGWEKTIYIAFHRSLWRIGIIDLGRTISINSYISFLGSLSSVFVKLKLSKLYKSKRTNILPFLVSDPNKSENLSDLFQLNTNLIENWINLKVIIYYYII